jgi:hypothetical protein
MPDDAVTSRKTAAGAPVDRERVAHASTAAHATNAPTRNRILRFLFPPEERERLLLTPRVFGENGAGARRRSGFLVPGFLIAFQAATWSLS